MTTTARDLKETLIEVLRELGPRGVLSALEIACIDLQECRLVLDDQASASYWQKLAEQIHKLDA